MEPEQAQALFVYMQKKLPDTDHLLDDYRAKAAFIRYLEESDYDQIVEACKTFKAEGRFPSIADLEGATKEKLGEETHDYVPRPIASKELGRAHLRAAREALNKSA